MTRNTGSELPPASVPPAGHVAPRRRQRRDLDAIAKAMQAKAHAAAEELGLASAVKADLRTAGAVPEDGIQGLSLGSLVERRWKVAPQTAAAHLAAAGLPVDGRRARLIYSWPSIFRAEGVGTDIAMVATRKTHPELFEDLLKPAVAAEHIGVNSDSTIRKLVLSGAIPPEAYVVFGLRGMRRFRPAFIEDERKRRRAGMLV